MSTLTCPVCLSKYPFHESMGWAPIRCLACGVLFKVPITQTNNILRPLQYADNLETLQAAPVRHVPRRKKQIDYTVPMVALCGVMMLTIVIGAMMITRTPKPKPITVVPVVVDPYAIERAGLERTRKLLLENTLEIKRLQNALREVTSTHEFDVRQKLSKAREDRLSLLKEEKHYLELVP